MNKNWSAFFLSFILCCYPFFYLKGQTSKNSYNLFTHGNYAQFQDIKRKLIFLDSGVCIGIHEKTSLAAVGFFKQHKNQVWVYFNHNKKEIFYLLDSYTLSYQGEILRKITPYQKAKKW